MKKKGILLFLLLFMLFPTIVFAEKPTTEFEGVVTAKPGDIVAYDIKVTTDTLKPSKYKAELKYDEDVLELKEVTAKGDGWNSISANKTVEFINSKGGATGTTIIATITFKVKDNVPKQNIEIKLTDIQVTTLDEKNEESFTTLDDKKVTLSITSTDKTLKDLKVDGVTIEDFKSDKYEYELEFSSDVDSIEIKAAANNANATFVEGYGSRTVELNYGENEVLVKVKSESGDIQVYKLIIIREDDRNTNNSLKEVVINSGKIKLELSKNKVDYTIKTYKLKTLEVDAVAVDSKAVVDIKIPEEIIVGDNVVVITVTSESGEEKIYTITFENSDKKIDTKVKTLYIKGHEINFDKNTMVYEVVFNKKYKKGLDIKVVTVSSEKLVEYKIYYNGKEITEDTKIDLKVGDKYEIKVMPIGLEEGEESDTTSYVISIVRDKRVNFFLVLELFIVLVLVILIIIQIIKRKKIINNSKQVKKVKKEEDRVSNKTITKEMEKTKVINDEELKKINNNSEE